MFNKLRTDALLFTAQHQPKATAAWAFAKENWKDIAIGLSVALIIEDVDDMAEASEVSATVDVLTAIDNGVV
jgi:hypothetical protein